MNNAVELGSKDGTAARKKLQKRGRALTALGACHHCADAFAKRMADGELTPDHVVDYGTAYLKAAIE